jgi:hypothetical protein
MLGEKQNLRQFRGQMMCRAYVLRHNTRLVAKREAATANANTFAPMNTD